MPEYDQLRASIRNLEELRATLATKIANRDGDQRTLTDLHQRVSKALQALNALG